MTTKTPEQIATQIESNIYSDDDNYLLTREEMREHLIAAIEADRAQRASALDALHEWAMSVSCFMAEDKSNAWSEELDALMEIEQMYELVDSEGEKK